MIFKMANCYLFLGKYEEALKLCDTGLMYYPKFTDLEYMKGVVLTETGKNVLAVRHFKRCLEMGEAPNYLNVIVGTGTYRPLFSLGEIFFESGDYESAVQSFKQCLLLNPGYQDALIGLSKTNCRMKNDDTGLKNDTEESGEDSSN